MPVSAVVPWRGRCIDLRWRHFPEPRRGASKRGSLYLLGDLQRYAPRFPETAPGMPALGLDSLALCAILPDSWQRAAFGEGEEAPRQKGTSQSHAEFRRRAANDYAHHLG